MAGVIARVLAAVGFEVATAGSGIRGLQLVREGEFSLVILDLMLPDLDGFSILASARELAPAQPVLVLSGLADVATKVRCLELGACDYVVKPFDVAEFVARVRVRAGEHAHRRVLRRGHYALDLNRRVVDDGERAESLTTREFLLLEYLMGRDGEPCSREELLEHVWGYEFDPGTNVVDVCIRRLRHKIGETSVETVRNVGYCFVGA
jgi:two-component system copper resistance phosphate regulon response regulator CusR